MGKIVRRKKHDKQHKHIASMEEYVDEIMDRKTARQCEEMNGSRRSQWMWTGVAKRDTERKMRKKS